MIEEQISFDDIDQILEHNHCSMNLLPLQQCLEQTLAKLDADQFDVVQAPQDAIISVISNAGSGKSFSLLTRALNISLRDSISPSNQVLITFTNKAAKELKIRWQETFESVLSKEDCIRFGTPWISTIHRFGLHVLSKFVGFKQSILTESRSKTLLKQLDVVTQSTIDIDFNRVHTAIDLLYSANEVHHFIWPHFNPDGSLNQIYRS